MRCGLSKAFVYLAFLVLIAPGRAETPRKPNIIFILADDLGYGDLGCYGQQRIRTPNIDRLAAEGLRFTQFYAGSTVCAPSRCTLMTGLHTGHCLIRANARIDLRPEDVTIAKVLKKTGYATGCVGKWGLGTEGGTGVPTRQGFDSYFGYLDQVHAHNYYPTFLVRNEERVRLKNVVPKEGAAGQGVASEKVQYSHDLIAAEALRFIDSNKEKPFFLYIAWTIPHANNEAGNKGMEVPDLGPYATTNWPEPQKGHAAMITRMDNDVGKLMALLKRHGLDERTLVVFSSDNGPHQEGGCNPEFNKSAGPLRGHKRDLYDGGIRVPCIARWPGVVPAGKTSDFIGAFWDVLPTLAEVAGSQPPERIDGISFLPTLRGEAQRQQHDSLFWVFFEQGGSRALRMGKWKAVQHPASKPIQLFDLESDLGEQHNIAAERPEIVAIMERKMDESYTTTPQWRFPPPRPVKKK